METGVFHIAEIIVPVDLTDFGIGQKIIKMGQHFRGLPVAAGDGAFIAGVPHGLDEFAIKLVLDLMQEQTVVEEPPLGSAL